MNRHASSFTVHPSLFNYTPNVIRRDGQKRAGNITAPTAEFESVEKSTKITPKSYRPKTLKQRDFTLPSMSLLLLRFSIFIFMFRMYTVTSLQILGQNLSNGPYVKVRT
jgi:hypothetical protein